MTDTGGTAYYNKLKTGDGIRRWINRCQFRSNRDAAAEIGISERSLYRLLTRGLPRGVAGHLLALHMENIENGRTG